MRHSVTGSVRKFDGCYQAEKWKIFFRDDSLGTTAYGTWSSNKYDVPRHAGVRRYGVAKMCATMMIGELQGRLDADPVLRGISIAGMDPGIMGTDPNRRGNRFTRVLLWPIIVPLLAPIWTWLQPNGPVRTIRKSAVDVLKVAFETGHELRGQFPNGSEVQDVVPEAADARKWVMVWADGVKYAELSGQDTEMVNWK